jgi:tetratricopeptide (TPR) repeat protein
MEAMARKLGLGPRPKTPDLVIPTAPVPQAAPVDPERAAEERRLRALQVIEQGEERQKIGDLNGALECFRNAEKMNHDDASIRMRIEAVTNLVAIQKVNDCIDQAREAMRKGDAAEAARCWERAWESRKSDASLLYNAAEVLAKHSTDYRRAADFAQRALQQDPKMVRGYVILAEAFIAANLKTSARGAIENLTRLDPHHASLKALREKLGPPSLAEQLGLKR